MDAELVTALDERAIAAVLGHYAEALDCGNLELYLSCFTADASITFRGPDLDLTLRGHEDLTRHFTSRSSVQRDEIRHVVTNVRVELDGLSASANSYNLG